MEKLSDIDLLEYYDYKTRTTNMLDILGKSYSTGEPTLYFSKGDGNDFHEIFQTLYDERNNYGVVRRKSFNTYLYRNIILPLNNTGMVYEIKLVGDVKRVTSVQLLMNNTPIQCEYIDASLSTTSTTSITLFTGLFTRSLPILKTAHLENWHLIITLAGTGSERNVHVEEYPVIQIFYSNVSKIINEPIMKTVCLKKLYVANVKNNGACVELPTPFRSFGIVLWTSGQKANEMCIKTVSLKNKETILLPAIKGECLSDQVPLSLGIHYQSAADVKKYYICFNGSMVLSNGTMEKCDDKFVVFNGPIVVDIELFGYYEVDTVFIEVYEPGTVHQEKGVTTLKN